MRSTRWVGGTTSDVECLHKFGKHWDDDMKCNMDHVTAPIPLEEMISTLKGLQSAKSPGPDRLPPWLFKRFAHKLAPFLVNLMNGILEGNEMPSSFKESRTIYILKKQGLDKSLPTNYRPISLMNVIAKIFATIVNRRLRQKIETVITKTQHGFTPNRSILDAILNVDTILELMNKEASAIFLDIAKAFDSVEHASILYAMKCAGFNERLILLIKRWISDNHTTVIVNGMKSSPINLLRGVRQGDPLSPILFVLAMDLLHKRVANRIKGFKPMKNFHRIPIVGFADDTALFPKNIVHLKRCFRLLRQFKSATGMEIAIHKCSYVTKHKKSKKLLNEMNMKPIPHKDNQETERYLGAELHSAGVKDTLSTRVDKAIEKMKMLRGIKYIHQRAKAIKTFVWPTLYYWFPFEELEEKDAKRLNEASWNYCYNGHPAYKTKMAKSKKAQDANKFSNGGVGLFDIQEFANHQHAKQFNNALLKKNEQIWAYKWTKNPNKKAKKSKKEWKKITRQANYEALKEWNRFQSNPPKIELEIKTKTPIWKKIIDLKVHPMVKNFVFKRCRRLVKTVKNCSHCKQSGYSHIIHGDCPMNQGKKYSMSDFLDSFNHKNNHVSRWSGATPAEIANAWYANWFTYQAVNGWLVKGGLGSEPPNISTTTSNQIRAKMLETLTDISCQLKPV